MAAAQLSGRPTPTICTKGQVPDFDCNHVTGNCLALIAVCLSIPAGSKKRGCFAAGGGVYLSPSCGSVPHSPPAHHRVRLLAARQQGGRTTASKEAGSPTAMHLVQNGDRHSSMQPSLQSHNVCRLPAAGGRSGSHMREGPQPDSSEEAKSTHCRVKLLATCQPQGGRHDH